MTAPATRGRAIAAMCKQCLYDPIGGQGTWRQQVEACTSTDCPLWRFRPVSAPKTAIPSTMLDATPAEGAANGPD